MTAVSRVDKPELSGGDDNIVGDTGGLASGAGAENETLLGFDTRVTVGDGARLEVVGIQATAGDFILEAYNDVHARDTVTLTTAGALSARVPTRRWQLKKVCTKPRWTLATPT